MTRKSRAVKKQKNRPHPYLSGNFAPVHQTQPLTPCSYTGNIPEDLAGGEYVRNGGNPVKNESLSRDVHWFDGDGMLTGVSFGKTEKGTIRPEFVNQYILTDVYLSSKTSSSLRSPILPSIATLVNPLSSLLTILNRILRTIVLVILSHLPGSQQVIKKISVANTAVLYHDGRALATCESGPPMRIVLPGLETVGWFNGRKSEGEGGQDRSPGFGDTGLFSFMREWATAHPRVDPNTKELLLYHSSFIPPYVNYSIVPSAQKARTEPDPEVSLPMLNKAVPGIASPKMMHDFGVTETYTIIMDLPLSLDPLNLAKNKPVVVYDPSSRSRFGIFPRYRPDKVRWFETNPCCIFHTANSWNSTVTDAGADSFACILGTETVNMLACRLTSASLVFNAGNLAAPTPIHDIPPNQQEDEQCRLYYYQFSLAGHLDGNTILHQWALSAVPFEFPSLRDSASMSAAKYIYGCSVSDTSFGAALGRAVKINSLVKIDVETLIERGKRNPPQQIKGCVDTRSLAEIIATNDPKDPIKVFKMPEGWYAQESRFVPHAKGLREDDGWILSYVFDESQLGGDGECLPDAKSELWIIDARNMTDVVGRVKLPQRVPYGLHGNWFSEEDLLGQRPIEKKRSMPSINGQDESGTPAWRAWMATRTAIEAYLQ
ncbi:MAG: hypothetical protein Q9217_001683 [Psora testacea]